MRTRHEARHARPRHQPVHPDKRLERRWPSWLRQKRLARTLRRLPLFL